MSKKKKVLILVGMVSLLVLTGCLNYFLNRSNDQNVQGDDFTNLSFFESTRATADKEREAMIAEYKAIIEDGISSDEAKANAEAMRAQLIEFDKTETTIETLIKALGFEDCVVTLSTDTVNIILKSDEMTTAEVAQVLDIILTETDKTASAVRLIPIE